MDASELADAHADEFLDGILFTGPCMGSDCASAADRAPSSG